MSGNPRQPKAKPKPPAGGTALVLLVGLLDRLGIPEAPLGLSEDVALGYRVAALEAALEGAGAPGESRDALAALAFLEDLVESNVAAILEALEPIGVDPGDYPTLPEAVGALVDVMRRFQAQAQRLAATSEADAPWWLDPLDTQPSHGQRVVVEAGGSSEEGDYDAEVPGVRVVYSDGKSYLLPWLSVERWQPAD